MQAIQTWRQQQVFNFWQDFRAMYGVSPTFEEAGRGIDPKHPVKRAGVGELVTQLAELGWLVSTGAGKSRCWVPTQEARLWDRWGEVMMVLRRVADRDAQAAEILSYVIGNGPRRTVRPQTGPVPVTT